MVGGMGGYTKELAKALTKLGHRVSVLTSVLGQEGGESFALYPRVSKWGFSSWKAILTLIKEIEPQILHLQYQAAAYGMHPAINLLPWRLRLIWHRPLLLVTFHDLRVPYLFPKAGPIRRGAIAALAKGCDGVIVTNVQDEAEARGYGLEPYLIPIGSNISPRLPPGYDREEWRARWGVKDETLLSYFGLLHESKGVETLFRALARLLEGGKRVKLLMVGGRIGASDPTTTDYAHRMEALGRELGLEILWTGYVDDEEVSANLLVSDMCVLPYKDGVSFRRGSLMAALAHGLPIISTRPPIEVKELIEGENIVLVPPDDIEALAAKIQKLAASEGLRRRLGRGAKRPSEVFSWERIAEETVALYSSFTGSQ